MKRYEAMFLFDNTTTHQWSDIEAEVRRLCDRIQADLQVCVKFDERKLAYEIQGRKRGTYVLTYFEAEADRIGALERDAQLSEPILRVLVLRADHISDERLAELKAWPPEQPLQTISAEGRRGEVAPARPKPEPPAEHKTDRGQSEARVEGTTQAAAGTTLGASSETATEGGTELEPKPTPNAKTEEPPISEASDASSAHE